MAPPTTRAANLAGKSVAETLLDDGLVRRGTTATAPDRPFGDGRVDAEEFRVGVTDCRPTLIRILAGSTSRPPDKKLAVEIAVREMQSLGITRVTDGKRPLVSLSGGEATAYLEAEPAQLQGDA